MSGFSATGAGVRRQSNGNTGVSGTGGNYGVKGDSANNYRVFCGTGGYAGVFGTGAYGSCRKRKSAPAAPDTGCMA